MVPPPEAVPFWRRMLHGRTRAVLLWVVLLASPFVAFNAVLLRGYTFSQSSFASDGGTVSGGETETLPVLDPAAASSQDEPWLFLIRKSLLHGEVPLVNLRNGLGAPLLETLQPGVLYPLNLLLILLPGNSPWMFDLFVLLHIELLLAGLYVLFRLYARDEVALVVALTVGLCGGTYQHLDMVHFRSYAWLPLGLAAAVRIARGTGSTRDALVFMATRVAAIASGALQSAFLSSLAIGAVFLLELWRAPHAASTRVRRFGQFLVLAVASALVAAPSVMPYLAARANQDLFTQATSDRSVVQMDPDAMLQVLLPHIHGQYPNLLRPERFGHWMTNYATVGAFFVVLGLVVVGLRRGSTRRAYFLGLAAVTTLATLKVQHLAIFDFFQRLPFVSEILYTKYHLSLLVLFGILGAIGIEESLQLAPRLRARLVGASSAAVVLLLAAVALWIWGSPLWRPFSELPEYAQREEMLAHAGSIGALFVAAIVLLRPGRIGIWVIAAAVVVQATLVVPSGWPKRLMKYWTPAEVASLSAGDGIPQRTLSRLPPNQNLFHDIESISVFDPVHLKALHWLYPRLFRIENLGFSLHPIGGVDGLSERELDGARLLGVTRVQGFQAGEQDGLRRIDPGIFELEDTLPRAFLLSREAFARIDASFQSQPVKQTLADIRTEIASNPRAGLTHVGSRTVQFGVERAFDGVAVVLQAFGHAWTLDGTPPRAFLSALCAWDVELGAGERKTIAYWPVGLTKALWVALLGLALAAFATWTCAARSRPTTATA